MEQKNFLLAIILSIGFLFVWSVFVVPRFTPPPTAAADAQTSATRRPPETVFGTRRGSLRR